MDTCRAAVITAHNQPLKIEQVPIPKLNTGSLLVRIAASTPCGTDVHRWHGPLGDGDTLPIITGHEPCGYVEDIAGERTDILGNPVKQGDRIVWSYVACGSCYYCSVALQPCICPGRASGDITAATERRTSSAAAPSTCTCRHHLSSSRCRRKFRRRPQQRLRVRIEQ